MARFVPLSPLPGLAALTALLLAVACAVAPAPTPTRTVTLPPLDVVTSGPAVTIALAPPAPLQKFLDDMKRQARAEGISDEIFAAATAGIAPIPAIATMNDNQPEFSRAIWTYLDGAVSPRRIRDAKAMLGEYQGTLAGIEKQSGVPAAILVAIWGMESDFGRDSGGFPLFSALATLGYQGPRADYAKGEFLAALRILQEQHYAVGDMKASWAGAFGQTQFTPTTFLKYAADGDHDGKIDLWSSPADALASAANLLSSQGWKAGEGWGMEVKLPKGFAYEDADLEAVRPVAQWRRLGVLTARGKKLPDGDDAAIYLPAGAKGPAFLIWPNFNVILKYNDAASYALAVAILSDRIMGRPAIRASWPRGERQLNRDERFAFQRDLTALGFDTGTPDGVLGRRTRAATRDYQKAHGLTPDGYPTAELLAMLESGARR